MQWCIDLDSMHMTGVSNGGMISYYVAATVTDGLGKSFQFLSPIFS